MSAKQVKEAAREAPPPELATSTPPVYKGTAQGYDFYLQSIYEIQRTIGKLEASMQSLTSSSAAHAGKLDDLAEKIHIAKGMVKAFGLILGAIGAVALLLLGTILSVLLKHFNLI